MIFKRYIYAGTVGLLILTMIVATSIAANRDFGKIDTVRIGVLCAVQNPSGQGMINSAKMAAEEINAAGGILGKKIEIVVGDTEGKPEQGVMAFKKLVLSDNVDAVIGPESSGVALAVQGYLSQYEVVNIGIMATPAYTENVRKDYNRYKYTFRTSVNSDRQEKWAFKFLTEFVHGQLGYNKIAILMENAKWVHDYAPVLKKDLEKAGLQVVYYEMFDLDVKDFAPIFIKIKSAGAQWISHVLAWSKTIPLIKAWYDNQSPPIGGINTDSQDSKYWEITDGKCLSEITYTYIARAPLTEKTIPMWDKYSKKYGTNPVWTVGFCYDDVYMLAEVIGQKKSVKTNDIINGLEKIKYNGVIHPETGFDKEHDILEGSCVMPMIQWQAGGKRTVIFPDRFKTGNYVPPPWWKK